ncbi:DoxX family protein [Aureibaculum sp. A20]|uniref:DoxX family protein n=1 Tax=Aureibaculum flavum TaxID=2795986 RepID=A0ABS0WT12_9FLAO|nr:BT_3928 family protein [Aureibaculum flavum]MBJ2175008.1 DoxX family protein [Aureibaculum flavum]
MKYLTHIARLLVAATFIFSGFVKLIDPLGSAYKFQDYFAADVLNLEFLSPFALPFSILLILAEIMLGVTLLIGFKPKTTVWSLLLLTLVFLFLTWYSAYYDKVTDCGCFGDAVKLTPWETFYKNVILIGLIFVLLFTIKNIKPLFGKNVVKWISFAAFMVFLYIVYYVLTHLPLIDFRPYAIGKNIPEGMIIPEGAKPDVYEDTWIYKVNGEDKEYTTAEKPWEIEGATFVDRKTVLIEKGYEVPIHDFSMERDGVDFTEFLMQKEKLVLIVMHNLSKTEISLLPKIKEFSTKALQEGYDVYAMSSNKEADFLKIKKEYNLDFDALFCDDITLKTMIRANPGIITLNKGTITGKWNANDADNVEL